MLLTLLIFVVLLTFIFLGFPIFMALLITGLIFLMTGGNSLGLAILKMFGSVNSLSLLAIPFFITAGNIIMKSKITDKLVFFADSAVGWLPGGLGHVNVLTSMIFGGIQGSGVADAAAIGGMLIGAIYNMTDTFFVGQLGTSAVAAVGILFPFMALMPLLKSRGVTIQKKNKILDIW